MFNIKNYIFQIQVKLGFKKPKRVGIKMTNCSDIRMKDSKVFGFDTAIEAENVSNFIGGNNEIK